VAIESLCFKSDFWHELSLQQTLEILGIRGFGLGEHVLVHELVDGAALHDGECRVDGGGLRRIGLRIGRSEAKNVSCAEAFAEQSLVATFWYCQYCRIESEYRNMDSDPGRLTKLNMEERVGVRSEE